MFRVLHFLVIFGLVFNQLLASAHGHHDSDHNEPIGVELAHVHLGHGHSSHGHSPHSHTPHSHTPHGHTSHSHSSHQHLSDRHSPDRTCAHGHRDLRHGHAQLDHRHAGHDQHRSTVEVTCTSWGSGFDLVVGGNDNRDEPGCCLVIPVSTVTGHIVESQSYDIQHAMDLDLFATLLLAAFADQISNRPYEDGCRFLSEHTLVPSGAMRLTRLCRLQL